MPLFFDIYFIHRYHMKVDEEKIDTYNILVGVCLCFVGYRCGLAAWMQWSCIDVIVLGLKSEEELYPFPPLGVDSADTSQLPQEKNLQGQFQYFQKTQPASSTVTPLYQS
jgi:hypothetical protein